MAETLISGNAVAKAPRSQRRVRRPTHPFYIEHKPMEIQPFFFAPVRPGETMRNLLWQARAVTDPLASPLIGWHMEYYFFYARLSKLRGYSVADIRGLFTDPNYSFTGSPISSAYPSLYKWWATGQVTTNQDWLMRVYQTVVGYWFRDDYAAGLVEAPKANGLFDAMRKRSDALQSAIAGLPESDGSDDFSVDLNANATITASEVDMAMDRWQRLKRFNMTDMTYEEYLASEGVNVPATDLENRPELIRYTRDWTYPTNTVNPADGVPTTAASWAVQHRADKDRRFPEPGFLIGVTICRPKVYMAEQYGNVSSLLTKLQHWLPGFERADSLDRWITLSDTNDVVNHTGTLSIDPIDLFERGEQFTSVDVSVAGNRAKMNAVTLDTPGGKFISSASIDALFKGAAKTVRQDGVVDVAIATHMVRDMWDV